MIEFIAALYNEENNLVPLITHVEPIIDRFNFVDDFSTDKTPEILEQYRQDPDYDVAYKVIRHTGLPETVKAEALKMCDDDSWIVMLDADERFAPGTIYKIQDFIESPASKNITHIWFNLEEAIDGQVSRYFLKSRVFRKSAITFSNGVHIADSFSGTGANFDWTVLHYKTSAKQITREKEYIETYNKLVDEGKMTPEKREELKAMHYFIR